MNTSIIKTLGQIYNLETSSRSNTQSNVSTISEELVKRRFYEWKQSSEEVIDELLSKSYTILFLKEKSILPEDMDSTQPYLVVIERVEDYLRYHQGRLDNFSRHDYPQVIVKTRNLFLGLKEAVEKIFKELGQELPLKDQTTPRSESFTSPYNAKLEYLIDNPFSFVRLYPLVTFDPYWSKIDGTLVFNKIHVHAKSKFVEIISLSSLDTYPLKFSVPTTTSFESPPATSSSSREATSPLRTLRRVVKKESYP